MSVRAFSLQCGLLSILIVWFFISSLPTLFSGTLPFGGFIPFDRLVKALFFFPALWCSSFCLPASFIFSLASHRESCALWFFFYGSTFLYCKFFTCNLWNIPQKVKMTAVCFFAGKRKSRLSLGCRTPNCLSIPHPQHRIHSGPLCPFFCFQKIMWFSATSLWHVFVLLFFSSFLLKRGKENKEMVTFWSNYSVA